LGEERAGQPAQGIVPNWRAQSKGCGDGEPIGAVLPLSHWNNAYFLSAIGPFPVLMTMVL
jgi:hypothetical protein